MTQSRPCLLEGRPELITVDFRLLALRAAADLRKSTVLLLIVALQKLLRPTLKKRSAGRGGDKRGWVANYMRSPIGCGERERLTLVFPDGKLSVKVQHVFQD